MKSDFFRMDGRDYVNNAVVIADVVDKLDVRIGPDIIGLDIKFIKPMNSQADLYVSLRPPQNDKDSNACVHGVIHRKTIPLYFSYIPNGDPLREQTQFESNTFEACAAISRKAYTAIEKEYERIHGTSLTDKIIFYDWTACHPKLLKKALNRYGEPNFIIQNVSGHHLRHKYVATVEIDGEYCGIRKSVLKPASEFKV